MHEKNGTNSYGIPNKMSSQKYLYNNNNSRLKQNPLHYPINSNYGEIVAAP